MLPPRDFKSLASAYSATPADAMSKLRVIIENVDIRASTVPTDLINTLMGGGGFEPPKQFAADLQSVPFGHSGIHPYEINS